MDDLKKILPFTPLLIGVLMFFGFVRTYYYYSHWGIEITPYLDLSEFLVLFLKDVHILGVLFISFLFHVLFSFELLDRINPPENKKKESQNTFPKLDQGNSESTELETKEEKKSRKAFKKGVESGHEFFFEKPNLIAVLIMLFISFGFGFWFYKTYSIIAFYLFILTMFKFIYALLTWFKIGEPRTVLVAIFTNLLLGTYGLIQLEISRTNDNAQQQTYSVELKNEKVIESNPNFYFIGQTSNYIFFYEEKESTIVTYPTADITSTHLKTNK